MVVVMNKNKDKKFHIHQQVAILNSDGFRVGIGTITNINNYRSPDERYAIFVEGHDDVVFLGEERLDYLE